MIEGKITYSLSKSLVVDEDKCIPPIDFDVGMTLSSSSPTEFSSSCDGTSGGSGAGMPVAPESIVVV